MNAENAGDEAGNPPTNHWTAFLQRAGGGSVSLDMTPGYCSDRLRGKIEISSKNSSSTQEAIKTVSFSTIDTPTFKTITDIITRNGRERYTFTEDWVGCRFWIFTIISDLERAGIVPSGSGQAALSEDPITGAIQVDLMQGLSRQGRFASITSIIVFLSLLDLGARTVESRFWMLSVNLLDIFYRGYVVVDHPGQRCDRESRLAKG